MKRKALPILRLDCENCIKIISLVKELSDIEYGDFNIPPKGSDEESFRQFRGYLSIRREIEKAYEICINCKRECSAREKAAAIFWKRCLRNE